MSGVVLEGFRRTPVHDVEIGGPVPQQASGSSILSTAESSTIAPGRAVTLELAIVKSRRRDERERCILSAEDRLRQGEMDLANQYSWSDAGQKEKRCFDVLANELDI